MQKCKRLPVVFAPNQSVQVVPVVILDDELTELRFETLFFSLLSSDARIQIPIEGNFFFNIIDDDCKYIYSYSV